jgi:hypothetical protein
VLVIEVNSYPGPRLEIPDSHSDASVDARHQPDGVSGSLLSAADRCPVACSSSVSTLAGKIITSRCAARARNLKVSWIDPRQPSRLLESVLVVMIVFGSVITLVAVIRGDETELPLAARNTIRLSVPRNET